MLLFVGAGSKQRMENWCMRRCDCNLSLKDNLKKCLDKRQQMSKSGAAASSLPMCKYFEQMRFLHDKTANRPTDSNITPLPVESTRNDICDPKAATTFSATTTLCPTTASCNTAAPSTSATTASNLSKRKASDAHLIPPVNSRHASKTTRQDAIDLAILKQLEKTDKKIDEASSNENTSDEIYLYCQSLIPIMRALPHKKQRKAMIRISQLLFDIEFDELQ